MSDQTTHPLKFDCYKCGKESTYPNYLTENEDKNAVQTVVKRCTNCSAENSIDVPKGYKSKAEIEVLRGDLYRRL